MFTNCSSLFKLMQLFSSLAPVLELCLMTSLISSEPDREPATESVLARNVSRWSLLSDLAASLSKVCRTTDWLCFTARSNRLRQSELEVWSKATTANISSGLRLRMRQTLSASPLITLSARLSLSSTSVLLASPPGIVADVSKEIFSIVL